jgi:hypothetical protein
VVFFTAKVPSREVFLFGERSQIQFMRESVDIRVVVASLEEVRVRTHHAFEP